MLKKGTKVIYDDYIGEVVRFGERNSRIILNGDSIKVPSRSIERVPEGFEWATELSQIGRTPKRPKILLERNRRISWTPETGHRLRMFFRDDTYGHLQLPTEENSERLTAWRVARPGSVWPTESKKFNPDEQQRAQSWVEEALKWRGPLVAGHMEAEAESRRSVHH